MERNSLSIIYCNHCYADLWYSPNGSETDMEPLLNDLHGRKIGYYYVPTFLATESGNLVDQVLLRAMLAIDCWAHVFVADGVFGLFARGARFGDCLNKDFWFWLKLLGKALYEGEQLLEYTELVTEGKNCVIDSNTIIHGPTTIGDNVTINTGTVIENCIIGNNVNVSQDCKLMLSILADGTFLPFRRSFFMTNIIENGMVAQNACLQARDIARSTFIGAGNTFTDNNLIPALIRSRDGHDKLSASIRPVLGECVGHNCRNGSGMIIFPDRTIESDVVLFATHEHRLIDRDVDYEDRDHHKLNDASKHPRLHLRRGKKSLASW